MAKKKKKKKSNSGGTGMMEKLTPVLIIVSIVLAFAVGVLWQKVENLGGGAGTSNTGTTAQAPDSAAQQAPQKQGPSLGKVSAEQAEKLDPVTQDDHVRGEGNIALIEYSDYECPFCSRFHPTAQQVLEEYDGQVKWVYRHFPLDAIHPKARPAAVAAECVADIAGSDAFWAFTDSIFEDQSQLSDLEAVATEVGVSASEFNSCVESEQFADAVESDYQSGLTAGVSGTPGNFILNEDSGDVWFVPGAYPYDQIKPYIEEALSS